jgi:hypothetical protein
LPFYGELVRNKIWKRGEETDSNTATGRWMKRERWAIVGKVAAKELEAQMMKREAMRRPLREVAPPPEPQFVVEDILRC